MKVYILYLDFGPYDGGMDTVGVYSTRERAEQAYRAINDGIPFINIKDAGKYLFDDVYFIDECQVDE